MPTPGAASLGPTGLFLCHVHLIVLQGSEEMRSRSTPWDSQLDVSLGSFSLETRWRHSVQGKAYLLSKGQILVLKLYFVRLQVSLTGVSVPSLFSVLLWQGGIIRHWGNCHLETRHISEFEKRSTSRFLTCVHHDAPKVFSQKVSWSFITNASPRLKEVCGGRMLALAPGHLPVLGNLPTRDAPVGMAVHLSSFHTTWEASPSPCRDAPWCLGAV